MAEHHEKKLKINNSHICKTLEMANRRCFATSARPTGNSVQGTSGGVLIAPLKHLSILPMDYPEQNKLAFADDDLVGFVLRLRGVDLLLVQVYFETGSGLGSVNMGKLKKLAQLVQNKRLNFIAFGDWNMPPERLAQSAYLGLMNAQIIVAEQGSNTCDAGKGAVLDYVMASNPICHAISDIGFFKAPWKTHAFITFKIDRAPRQKIGRFLIRPLPILNPEEESDEDPKSIMESGERSLAPADEAATPKLLPRSTADCVKQIEQSINWTNSALLELHDDCITLGAKYLTWSSRAEGDLMQKFDRQGQSYTG